MSTVTTKQNNSDTVFTKQYSYYHGNESNATTNMVGGISYKLSSDKVLDYSYNYTDTGNVENVYENGKKVAVYTYDELNQLVWYADTRTGRYIRIVYDNYGNIQRMESYLLGTNWAPVKLLETRTYSYGDTNWKDKLTEFDGDSITYDRNGNPLTYRDDMTFEWENGRILKNITTSDKAIQMSYDSNGMRTQKSVDGVKTNYYYDSNKNLISLVKGNDTLLFYYDSDGSATSFSYNGTMYFYVKNLQGDVIRIIDLAGTEVASYVYDAWGNIKDTKGEPTIREINPIRYRGYVYDTETSLYYLQSRYYDPFAGRFVNADSVDMLLEDQANILQSNLFCYVFNDCVNEIDPDGNGYFFVGFGLQLAFPIGTVSGGLELLWITSKKVSAYGQSRYIPFVYFFASLNSGKKNINSFKSYLKPFYRNPSKLLNPKNLLKGVSVSVCFFVVFGNSKFKNPSSYAGRSVVTTISVRRAVGYSSWSSSGFCVGGGMIFSSKCAFFTYSKSACMSWRLTGKGGLFAKLYSSIKSKSNKYR